ncbi:7-carboxy-7-deazaguanine synthase [uncultured archaeon]|nr:7-carboxy-7-deazaguanine synthase [uncultured archaeon]
MSKKKKRLIHHKTTKFGEEVPPLGTINIRITSRCNFACDFCFARDEMRGPDMTFEEFKRVINQIDEASKNLGQKPKICVGGGEPFLNKETERMMSYAVGLLGRDRVEITTNLSTFPTNSVAAERMLARMGFPKINMSIDREHLRFGKQVKEKILALSEAARRTKTTLTIIAVTKSPYERTHMWPKSIKRAIPGKLKLQVKDDNSGYANRLEQYHAQNFEPQMTEFINSLMQGKGTLESSRRIRFSANLMPHGWTLPQRLTIANDGKVYIYTGVRALHSPLLSIGSWRREALTDMVNHALPYKREMIKNWIGAQSFDGKEILGKGFLKTTKPNSPKKQRLFGSYIQRRFNAQKPHR